MTRPLKDIAVEIEKDIWAKDWAYYALPYVKALKEVESINDRYYDDSAKSVVLYLLSNLTYWRGEKARTIKAELKELLREVGN